MTHPAQDFWLFLYIAWQAREEMANGYIKSTQEAYYEWFFLFLERFGLSYKEERQQALTTLRDAFPDFDGAVMLR